MWFSYNTVALLLSYSSCVFCAGVIRSDGPQKDLVRQLFANYSKALKPVRNGKATTITAKLDHALYSIISLNSNLQQLTYTMWLRVVWHDPTLIWFPSLHNGIRLLKLPSSVIWIPDITPVGVTKVENEMPPENVHAVSVSYNGEVTYLKSVTVTLHCELLLGLFPFDEQNCSTLFVSWQYNEKELRIIPTQPSDLKSYKESIEWTLLSFSARNSSVSYGVDTEAISQVHYDIVIKRKSFYYVSNYALPTFAITLLTIIGLFSPFNNTTERQEKVTMGLTCLLTINVMLLKIQTDMPTSENIPLLGIYEMGEMFLSGVATLCSVTIMYLDNSLELGKVPSWFYKFITTGMDDLDEKKGKPEELKVENLEYISQSEDKQLVLASPPRSEEPLIQMDELESHVSSIHKMLSEIQRRLAFTEKREKTRRRGVKICRKMDDYALAVFVFLDVLLTALFILYGYCFS